MQWLCEKERLQNLINEGVSYNEIGKLYNVSGAAIRKAASRIGISLPRRRRINPNETFNKGTANKAICLYCGQSFTKYPSSTGKYCSKKCETAYKIHQYVEDWKLGKISGTTGYTCSSFVRNYLLQKHEYKCERCGWGEINPFTNKSPLQIHHIDGNSENNVEENLQVLCPNCHSLTENFGSRNTNAPRGKSKYYGKARAN